MPILSPRRVQVSSPVFPDKKSSEKNLPMPVPAPAEGRNGAAPSAIRLRGQLLQAFDERKPFSGVAVEALDAASVSPRPDHRSRFTRSARRVKRCARRRTSWSTIARIAF